MFNWRHTIVLTLFFFTSLSVTVISFMEDYQTNSAKQKVQSAASKQNVSQMDNFYYFHTKEMRRYQDLEARTMKSMDDVGRTLFTYPIGKSYDRDDKPVSYQADEGEIDKKKNYLVLKGNVYVYTDTFDTRAELMEYFITEDLLKSFTNVRSHVLFAKNNEQVFINGDEAVSFPKSEKAIYTGNVNGSIKRKRVYEENVDFKGDVIRLDGPQSEIHLDGHVWLKKTNMTATSRRGEIFLENYNKALKYYVLYDDVKLVEIVNSETSVLERRAFGEKLTGIQSEDKIILTGYPKVFQGNDVIKGNRITLRENNQIIEVDDANSMYILKE